ncbi:MAG TPA: hypothetical protein VEI07_20000 [Planctomycetaceae bacterium]|nr:hypothetical protein [Planctomycetaceae bacterium]
MQPSDPNAQRHDEPGHGAEPSPPVRPEVRFEERDVRFRWVLIVTVVSCAIGIGVFVLVRGFYWAALEARKQPTAFAPREKPTSQLPPEPRLELLDRLEKTPASNVARWEQGEEKSLETYGPSDEKNFVRIPLQRAMQMLAGHLPARKEADRPKFRDKGLVDAGESNSGRMFRGAGQ